MCRKLVYLISLATVLVMMQSASAGLVGHWTFDDGSGTVAADSSGKGNNGTILGNATWVAGRIGSGALSFDASDDIVMVGDNPSLDIEDALTICLWVKAPDVVTPNHMVTKQPSGSAATNYPGNYEFRIKSNTIQFLHQTSQGTDYSLYQSASQITAGEWHHAAVSIVEGGLVELYLDGVSAGSVAQTGTFGILNDDSLRIGGRKDSKFFNGILDDVYIYDRALTPEQIAGLRDGIEPAFRKAENPSIPDSAVLENTWANLTWTPGDAAVSHSVYMGDNFDDVNAGTGDTFRGNTGTPSLLAGFPGYTYPGGLVPGTTYYWRIDEVNDANRDSPWKGDIWSFTIPPKTAYSPDPADGGKFVLANVTLNWAGGLHAILHTVYFGDNFDDINNAAGGLATTTAEHTPAGPLEQGKTYYWRVDEFDGAATHKGNVWSFTTIPVVPVAADPNLVVLWTLDEGMGTTAVDWSGHGHHGTVIGAAQWVGGFQGTALSFADDIYVETAYPGVTGTAARTCCAWIKTRSANRNIMSWGQNVAGQKWRMRLDATGGLRIENNGGYHYGVTNLADGRWHHVAVAFPDDGSPDILDTLLYVDAQLDITAASQATPINTAAGPLRIGESPWHNAPFIGVIDEARVYNKALTQEEIALVMRVDPLLAWAANPAEDSTPDIEHATPLTWSRGDKATQHEVYFGLDKAGVANADASDTTGVYRGRQSATSYTPAEGLEWGGGPYFWRVDENNNDGTVTKGRIWSFTVGDFLVVDDIESYNDVPETDPGSNRIYLSWIDGFGTTTNGAFVGNLDVPLTEHSNVHSGGQAMPLSYDNNFKFSEATLTLTGGNDWTRQGVTELSLWYRGLAANAGERMYVALNGTAVVYHNDPNAAQKTTWTEWAIPLQTFAGQGVNLANVTSITIGFGTRGNTTLPGGTGQMYIDDIRLYRPATAP